MSQIKEVNARIEALDTEGGEVNPRLYRLEKERNSMEAQMRPVEDLDRKRRNVRKILRRVRSYVADRKALISSDSTMRFIEPSLSSLMAQIDEANSLQEVITDLLKK